MSRSADVVVVGGGIMGVNIALQLAQRGAGNVELIEKSHPAAGSSGKSGAILRQHYGHRETVRMAREGLHYYAQLSEAGEDIGFSSCGMLLVVPNSHREALQRAVAMQCEEGVPARVVGETEMADIEGRGYYEADIIACHEADSGFVDPRRTVESIFAHAQAAGVRSAVGERIDSLLTKGDRVVGVRGSHGDIHCDHVVLATGPWSVALCRDVGWQLPLSVRRPEQAFFEAPAGFGTPVGIFADMRVGHYWKSEGPRHTRVGDLDASSDELISNPDQYDEGVSDAFIQGCRNAIAHRIPAYARATAWGGCAALYTMTPDEHPIIGSPEGSQGITLVTGFSGHGFKLGPAVGRGVAEWIVDGAPAAFPAAFFRPERFAEGDPICANYGAGILG